MIWIAKVLVSLKPGILDVQGRAVEKLLLELGYRASSVKVGKVVELRLEAQSREEASSQINRMTEEILCNPLMESFDVTLTALGETRQVTREVTREGHLTSHVEPPSHLVEAPPHAGTAK